MTKTVYRQIIDKLMEMGAGSIVLPSDLIDIGDDDSVRKTLSNLVKQEYLIRLSQGIYLFPIKDKEFGILQPSADDIVEAIVRRDKIRIMPTGVQAIYKLGLSTQIPMNIVYLTDGSSRKIKIGKRTMTFKKTNPKKLSIKGKYSGLAIQALAEIGKNNITEEIIFRIGDALKQEPKDVIMEDIKLAPAWIRSIIKEILKERKHEAVD